MSLEVGDHLGLFSISQRLFREINYPAGGRQCESGIIDTVHRVVQHVDQGEDVAVDRDGNVYVTGHAYYTSTQFPIWDPVQAGHEGSNDAFVTAIVSANNVYTYGFSTFVGENLDDRGTGIVVDKVGTVYVAGWTFSSGFATPGAVDATYGGNRDTFLAILDRYRVYLPVVVRQYP